MKKTGIKILIKASGENKVDLRIILKRPLEYHNFNQKADDAHAKKQSVYHIGNHCFLK